MNIVQIVGIILLVVLAIVVIKVITGRGQVSTDKQEFLKTVRETVERDAPQVKVKGQKGFGLVVDLKGEELCLPLDGLYNFYKDISQQASEHALKGVDGFVSGLRMRADWPDPAWNDAKLSVFPVLKSAEFLDTLRNTSQGVDATSQMVIYDWDHNLKILVAMECYGEILFVMNHHLDKWSVPKDDLLNIAVENLQRKTKPLWQTALNQTDGTSTLQFITGDNYDATRIMLPEFTERASQLLGCEKIAVAIPHADMLVAVSADKPEAVETLKRYSEMEYKMNKYPLTPEVLMMAKTSDN